MVSYRKTIVLGLDGLEPRLTEAMLERGELPHLARLRTSGGYARVATTCPAQTPVAWSTFATGTNPGGHGIFDFIGREPGSYLPNLALNRYERKNSFTAPRAVNLRRGTPLWDFLSQAGITSTVLRCPCTYPPDTLRGRLLAGMGVPDLRGGLGTPTFFTTNPDARQGESEQLVRLEGGGGRPLSTALPGPRTARAGGHASLTLTITTDPAGDRVLIRSEGEPRELAVSRGKWSDWLRVRFKLGLLQSTHGLVRFHLVALAPHLELYASPVNFAPDAPMFPMSSPPEYAGQLAQAIGPFHTAGMVEDHTGLNNGRFGEEAFLDQCETVMREREAMLHHELARLDQGFLFCLFDTPDRIQHMFWRFREADHPARRESATADMSRVIEDHYRRCDAVVGRVLEQADERTLLVVLSDHGFGSFRRGVHLNTWLHDEGYLALRPGVQPGEEAGDFFGAVDWGRTRAYALGLGSIYLNMRGREPEGKVEATQARALAAEIAQRLTGLHDRERGHVAVRGVALRDEVYSGPCAADAPDLVVRFGQGYRASWGTALGGVPAGRFEDNTKRWSGDHIVDPELVPGVLFMNRPFDGAAARLLDLAPTVLASHGVPKGPAMEGRSLLR